MLSRLLMVPTISSARAGSVRTELRSGVDRIGTDCYVG